MTLKRNLHWFIVPLFLFACARQSSPTGGPKDTIPPTLIRSSPPNESVNFKGKSIELEFSENVILNSPKEQLIITPAVSKEYKIHYRRNLVTITLEEPLQDSTTYTFNFREAVGDITEKNPVENLQLAYSTGTYIDSLSIEGTVTDRMKGTPVADATVALHAENDTFNIFEHPATYFTKTDKEGKFIINHLKPDNYFLYAFLDKNRNLIVNSRTEAYAYLSEYQYLLENLKEKSLGLIRLDAGPLKISSARPFNTYFNIRTTKPLRTFTLNAVDSSKLTYSYGEDHANIRIYKTTDKDSIQIHLVAIDSIDNAIDTTLYAKYLTREVTPEDFKLSLQSSSLLGHRGRLTAKLQFTKPVADINYDSIYFQIDSLTRVNLTSEDLTTSSTEKTISINKQLDPSLFTNNAPSQQRNGRSRNPSTKPDTLAPQLKPINELTFGRGAFISVENDSTTRATQPIKPVFENELSIINLEIRTDEESFIVQLLDKSQTVLRQVTNDHQVRFTDVPPGEYQIRLIIDSNQNGRWDPGNYFKHTEPEPVIYYKAADGSTTIKGVKANWEIGTEGEMFITY